MTRKFSSYGPISITQHYYTPRQALIDQAYQQLVGENPPEGGHYITIWAPRQRGKTWLFQQVTQRIMATNEFEVAILTLQSAQGITTVDSFLELFVSDLARWFKRELPKITKWDELPHVFSSAYFSRPVILILDEFDTLEEHLIAGFVGQLRSMYTKRVNEVNVPTGEKSNLLHGVALIGVRASLGIDNPKGSPFNVQRGFHVPNLTLNEVLGMLEWYQRDSGQTFEAGVMERVFYETQGQPGLVSWFGELLTETYNKHNPTITMHDFEVMYGQALNVLPNNTILNIISKAKQEPYQQLVLELFETGKKKIFTFDNPILNFLYLNGVIDYEQNLEETELQYARFPNPFIQRRLFNYFSYQILNDSTRVQGPFEDVSDTITETNLFIKPLLGRYERYLQANREWILREVPRRVTDLRVFEAVYHFSLYAFLSKFLRPYKARVIPEFPTGNGKIDLLLTYQGQRYGLELKSFSTAPEYKESLKQAANYARQLGLSEITLVMFIEAVDEMNRAKYEAIYTDPTTQVQVKPIFVQTGEG